MEKEVKKIINTLKKVVVMLDKSGFYPQLNITFKALLNVPKEELENLCKYNEDEYMLFMNALRHKSGGEYIDQSLFDGLKKHSIRKIPYFYADKYRVAEALAKKASFGTSWYNSKGNMCQIEVKDGDYGTYNTDEKQFLLLNEEYMLFSHDWSAFQGV